jgi:hypothetical protein
MKGPLLFTAALIFLGFVLWKQTERFQPEFLRKEGLDKTLSVENSSYNQVTNHLRPAVETFGPIAGSESPFQVNQYRAHIQ